MSRERMNENSNNFYKTFALIEKKLWTAVHPRLHNVAVCLSNHNVAVCSLATKNNKHP